MKKMGNFLLTSFVAYFFYFINIGPIKCEDTVFRIRKCCAENELMIETTGRCVDYKLLKFRDQMYHMNVSKEEQNGENIGSNNSWPWWFPPQTKIISKKTNTSLVYFPKQYQLIAGKDQPCNESDTSYLPAYFYEFSFYDDGSILIHPKKDDQYTTLKSEMLFDPLSFCIDRIDLNVDPLEDEDIEPILEISETQDYMVKLCPCTKATCILKCCAPGFLLRNDNGKITCIRNTRGDWTPIYSKEENHSPDYFLLHGMPECKDGESVVVANYPDINTQAGYVIYSNGTARVNGHSYTSEYMKFCGEIIIDSKDNKIHNNILRCYSQYGYNGQWGRIRKILYGWISVICAIFLFLTLAIHSSLPSLQKLYDKSLICQTLSLFVGYVSVAITQLGGLSIPQGVCTILGFIIQYSFLSAFFWLNVLCLDVSYTFGSLRGNYKSFTHRKKVFCYFYGWIIPGLIVLATIIIEFWPGIPSYFLKPEISQRCWFKNGYIGYEKCDFLDIPETGSMAQLAYFYAPIGTLLAINFFLFFFTSFKIMAARNDISNTIRTRNSENQRFLLYLKLFILMGASWITEFISWAIPGPEYYWFIPDIVNLLRALFIFLILCCKRKVVEELKNKICNRKDQNVRRPSNTRSTSAPGSTQWGDSYRCSSQADSSL